jgi:activator of HSP90 ATPase
MISGEYVSLEENKKLVMKWKMRDWATHSDVVITFD